MDDDYNKKSLDENVSELTELFVELLTKGDSIDKSDKRWEKASDLMKHIITDLMWSPGQLIYIRDPRKLQQGKAVVDFIWNSLDTDEMFDEITGGGYAGLLVNIIGDYIDRAKLLKPTFVSINPFETELWIYFDEAMKSWLFGLNNAALILSCIILESLIKEKLCQINVDLVYDVAGKDFKDIKQKGLGKLIGNAYDSDLLNSEERRFASKVKKLRDDSVHRSKPVDYKEVYWAIIKTKELAEKLLTE